jgi:iron-sulfur cluster assembly accessory protein
MLQLTETAASKVKEIMTQQNPAPAALRVAVVGGGCSGFSYHMAFDNQENSSDNVYEFEGVKVYVDQMSEMYLDGVQIDYIESLEGAGFKFNAVAAAPSAFRIRGSCQIESAAQGAAGFRPPWEFCERDQTLALQTAVPPRMLDAL